jgi:hypothetical protein
MDLKISIWLASLLEVYLPSSCNPVEFLTESWGTPPSVHGVLRDSTRKVFLV